MRSTCMIRSQFTPTPQPWLGLCSWDLIRDRSSRARWDRRSRLSTPKWPRLFLIVVARLPGDAQIAAGHQPDLHLMINAVAGRSRRPVADHILVAQFEPDGGSGF